LKPILRQAEPRSVSDTTTPAPAMRAAGQGPTRSTAPMWMPDEKLKLPGGGSRDRAGWATSMSSATITAAASRARAVGCVSVALTAATAKVMQPAASVAQTSARAATLVSMPQASAQPAERF